MDTIKVIGLGAMNLDQLYRVERILVDGEAPVERVAPFPGGSAANTIYGLARLGVRTGFIGAIGDDEEGQTLLKDFESVAVDTTHIKIKKNAKTGSVLCLTDKKGRRALYVSPGANSLLTRQELDPEYINRARVIHLSSFVNEEQLHLQMSLLNDISSSVKVSFAPGMIYATKGLAVLTPLIKRTQLLFVNRSELKQLTGEDFRAGAQRCLEQGCHTVVVTFGKGIASQVSSRKAGRRLSCYIADVEREYIIKTQRTRSKGEEDTTGAGDAFATGFLYGLLHQKSPEECGFLADIVAQFSLAKLGARAGLPSLGQLSEKYRQLYGSAL